MIIKALKKDWEVRPITFKDRRYLYKENVKVYTSKDKFDWDLYYEMIEFVLSTAFEDHETFLKDIPDVGLDELAREILQSYLNLEKK